MFSLKKNDRTGKRKDINRRIYELCGWKIIQSIYHLIGNREIKYEFHNLKG